jgi:transposase
MRCSRRRGKKGQRHANPADPPRRRAHKRKGHGTSETDRPPVGGTIGRRPGRGRLRVREHTDGATLPAQVHRYTSGQARCYTAEGQGYARINRPHGTGCQGVRDWARDADGEGIREVHINTLEGLWTAVRNFRRPLRGVHKKYLKDYLAICEHRINRKRISPAFIAGLVAAHKTQT